jgi:hypothetical protein
MTLEELRRIVAVALNRHFDKYPDKYPSFEANVSTRKEDNSSFELEITDHGSEKTILYYYDITYKTTVVESNEE